MSEGVLIALIAAVVPIISAVLTVVVLVINNRQTLLLAKLAASQTKTEEAVEGTKKSVENAEEKLTKLERNTDGMSKALLEITEKEALGRGRAEERDKAEVKAEEKGEAKPAGGPSLTISAITVPEQTLAVEPHKKP